MFMNEYEIAELPNRFGRGSTPNLFAGAQALDRLCQWTNRNSDGWPYWRLPTQAAKKLMTLLGAQDPRLGPVDCTEKELKAAFTPIKSFLTKQGVDHALIFPPPPAKPNPKASTIEALIKGKWVKLDPDDNLVVFRVNGRDVCAVDIFYVDPDNQLDEGDEPYLVAGHWRTQGPDGGEDWTRDAVYYVGETTS